MSEMSVKYITDRCYRSAGRLKILLVLTLTNTTVVHDRDYIRHTSLNSLRECFFFFFFYNKLIMIITRFFSLARNLDDPDLLQQRWWIQEYLFLI